MSKLKLRSPFAPPPLDRSSGLPLLLVVLLCAALAFQALAGNELELPLAGPVRGKPAANPAEVRPGPVGGAGPILARDMFAPAAAPAKEGDAGQGPLGGYSVVGSIEIGRTPFAIVQAPGPRILRARTGAALGEWRIGSIARDEVQLSRGSERLIVRFGPTGPIAVPATQGRGQ